MPPKGKKKRASLHLDETTGQIESTEVASVESKEEEKAESADQQVRQVVEIVDDAGQVTDEAIETIKKDAAEIEEVAEKIEETIEEKSEQSASFDAHPQAQDEAVPQTVSEESSPTEETKGSVESLFAKATSPITPEITVVGKKDRSIGVWVGAMLGVVLAIGVSLVLFVKGPGSLSFFAPAPTPTPTVAPTPTATPAVSLNRKDIRIAVVNGGGVAGAGSKMKAVLEKMGYVVSTVSNADEYSYTQTEIHVKAGKEAAATMLKDDLKADYTISSTVGAVDAGAAYDVQLIVGKE